MPPVRANGVPLLRKYKIVPVLLGYLSPECALPPVEVHLSKQPGPYRFTVYNGYHRFYASIAVGYPYLPAIVRERLQLW